MAKQKVEGQGRCYMCNMDKPLSKFCKSNSHIYLNGHLPVCNDCIDRLFESFRQNNASDRKSIQRVCMLLDVYYSDALFQKYNDGENNWPSKYIKKASTLGGKTFENTIMEGFVFSDNIQLPEDDFGETDEVVVAPENLAEKWGVGFSVNDYNTMENHYKYLKNANPNCDSNQELFIVNMCYNKAQQLRALREGNVELYNKLSDSYIKTFNAAGLKTVQDDSSTDEDTWSAWVSLVSQYTPEEYYKDKQLYKDIDGIGEYYERHAIRPLRNIIDGTDIRDTEYFVKDGDDDG